MFYVLVPRNVAVPYYRKGSMNKNIEYCMIMILRETNIKRKFWNGYTILEWDFMEMEYMRISGIERSLVILSRTQ